MSTFYFEFEKTFFHETILYFGAPIITLFIHDKTFGCDKIFSSDKTFGHDKYFSSDKTFAHDKIFSSDKTFPHDKIFPILFCNHFAKETKC
jgi:hypothetical protein